MKKNSNTLSRRSFLGLGATAAVATGVATLAGCAPETPANTSGASGDISFTADYDVVVIGFGLGGAASAVSAADAGAKVLLLEKAPLYYEGGNSHYCEQQICTFQSVQDGIDYLTVMAEGFNDATSENIAFMAQGTMDNNDWVKELSDVEIVDTSGSWPANLDLDSMLKIYGKETFYDFYDGGWIAENPDGTYTWGEYAIWPDDQLNENRMHLAQLNAPDNAEKKLWKFFRQQVVDRAGSIDVWFQSPALELIQDPSTKVVYGVRVDHAGDKINVHAANGVIVATGSYEGSHTAFQEYSQRAGMYPIGSIFDTGDGVTLTTPCGAKLWHMGALSGPWINPKVPNEDRCYWTNTVFWRITRAGNCINVDRRGQRFMSESGAHKHGHIDTGGTYQSPHLPEIIWAVFDETAKPTAPLNRIAPELVISADTIEALAAQIEVNPANLKKTVEDYNSYCENGHDLEFNRHPETLAPIQTAPFYAVRQYPCAVNAQAGAKRNTDCNIVDVDDKPIPHLYSAGEFGSFWAGAYMGGGNVSECMYTGRAAGRNAAQVKDDSPSVTASAEKNGTELFDWGDPSADVAVGSGEYAGWAEGLAGPIVVKVKVDSGKMSNIEIVSQHETASVIHDLFEKMPAAMIETNSVEVDGVAGATCTTQALRKAVQAALDKAQ